MIHLSNVSSFQKAISALSNFISEGNFRFNESGISLKAMDASQILLVEMKFPKNAFQSFDVEPSFVGLDIGELNRILSRSQPNDSLRMELTDSELRVELEGETTRLFQLPLLDLAEDEAPTPNPKFDAKIQWNGRLLKEALKDASLFGSSVVLRAKQNQFVLESKSSKGAFRSLAKELSIQSKITDEVVSKYSLGFLQNMVKELEPETPVHIELKSDSPLRCVYSIGPAEFQYHLAHMIL